MKLFKNKFFICILCIALSFTVFLSVFSILGINNLVKNLIGDMLSPAMRGVTWIKNSLEGYALYFKDIDSLIKENQSLKDQIDDLEQKLSNAALAQDENTRLKDYLSIKEAYSDFEFCEALVIGSQSENYNTLIKINVGTSSGIEVGMPVITPAGVVGCISEVGDGWSNVRVITEPSSGVGGYILRSGETGVVEGDVTYSRQGVCRLSYLSADADVKIGDLVYTTGSGGVYPGGLLIGKVASIGINEYNRTKSVTVECAVDMSDLKYVLVVTDFNMYSQNTEVG